MIKVDWNNIDWDQFDDAPAIKSQQHVDSIDRNRLLAQDPEWRKKNAESNRRIAQDPKWRKSQAEGSAKRSQDPEWRKKNAESNRRIAQDPEWRKKNAEAIAQRTQDPKWQKNTAESNRRQAQDPEWRAALKAAIRLHQGRAIVTPEGQFDSRAEAVDYYWDNKILPTRKTRRSLVRYFENQLKKEGSGFYYV